MTNEEALKYIQSKSKLIATVPRSTVEGTEAFDACEFFKVAAKAIANEEKYRWHDLRKNPEDLPPLYRSVIASDGNEEHECRYTSVYGWYFYAPKQALDVKWESKLNYPVIAWKYIEPFEVEE